MASLEVIFRPGARADISEAMDYYSKEDDGRLVSRFLYTVEEAAMRVRLFPPAAPRHFGSSRRVKLRKFPYWFYYRITEDTVEVLPVLHHKRSPSFVRKRLR